MRQIELVQKQELVVLAAVLIIIGAIIWLVPWPAPAEAATNIVGQIVFWIGIAMLILWFVLVMIYYAKTN